MAGPDDLLNPDPSADLSMEAFQDTFGPATNDLGEFDLPPPAPSTPRKASPFQSVAPTVPSAEGVTININKGAKNGQATPSGPKVPPNDPLSWLASNVEGKLRIERKPGTGVTSNGRATRGRYKGKYVGIGDCDVVEVMGSQELKSHIVEHWGGGEYIIHHLDKRDQKISSSPPLRLAQDPKPIEGVSEDDEDENDNSGIDLSFLNGPLNPPQQPPPPPMIDAYGRPIPTDPWGRPYQVPQQPAREVFQPTWVQENLENERGKYREEIEAEREARRAAEAAAERAAMQREKDAERAELQRQADRMAAEMAALRESLNKPQNTGLDTMLQMMVRQQEAAQQRFENEARERREREDREAKEARQKAEAERVERREREEKAEKERRERDERLEKERREDRKLAQEMAEKDAARNQQFMTMVLGQKTDPLAIFKLMNEKGSGATDPMSALNMAFSVVERAKDLGGGGGDDEPQEGGIAGAIRAMVPAVRPMAEAFARGMAGPQPVVYQRMPGQVQQIQQAGMPPRQLPPPQQGQQPQPQQAPQQAAPPAAPQSGGVDPKTFAVAKIVGMAGKGFALNKDPEVIAAAMLGAANMSGLMDHIGMIAAADPTLIHSELTAVLNVGLPQEQSQQIQSFLDIYTKPGGREWIKELIDEMNGVNEPDSDEESEDEGEEG